MTPFGREYPHQRLEIEQPSMGSLHAEIARLKAENEEWEHKYGIAHVLAEKFAIEARDLEAARDRLLEALREIEDMAEDRMDAEYTTDSPSPKPNDWMRVYTLADNALRGQPKEQQ